MTDETQGPGAGSPGSTKGPSVDPARPRQPPEPAGAPAVDARAGVHRATAVVPPGASLHSPVQRGAPRYRDVPLGGSLSANFTPQADGVTLATSTEPLRPCAPRLTDRLLHWAAAAPGHTLAAKRHQGGEWRRISYAQALHSARCIAQALIDMKLSADRPVVVLSDNDLEQLLLGLGAMLAGVPFAPVSVACSTVSQDYGKLKHILGALTPGLVFASSASAYGRAIVATVPADVAVVLTSGKLEGRHTFSFDDLLATVPTAEVDEAHAKVGPDTIAKFLFTSGSTQMPKGVINTQRMLCSNQQMILQCFPSFGETRPVLVDWLPWSHTFGGNHNVGLTIYNGGTLYIDEGKPTPALIGETLRNLREIAPTVYFNVPKGFEEIANALETDAALRDSFFSRVKMLFFAGAGLSQPVWDKLDRMAELACGERIRMLTGLGMTETAPFAICANGPEVKSGHIGLPAPGMTLKLVPVDGKLEVRYKGPNVTPGYWRAPEQTADAFDADGYYASGDALKYIDPQHPDKGFAFDGRIAEDFKLATGTFVSVGPLRARVIAAGSPCVQDVVVAGINRNELGLLIFPVLGACRELAGAAPDTPTLDVLAAPAVRQFFQELADSLHRSGTGSATRVARSIVLVDAPSIDRGEITDKGSINQRAVLLHRDAIVEHLYAGGDHSIVLPRV
ncbi:MAG: feruloyl-CoA synthase [Bacteriovorax sp.]|nr:feruloyl-CoA synthase [Rhizobacter sp.]